MKALWLGMAAALMASSAHAALTISTAATSNVTCSAGVCSATAKKAVLSVSDLTNMLAAGSVTVESGDQAQDVTVDAAFSWTSAGALTLDAKRSLTVNKAVADSGPAALTLSYGKKGDLRFGPKSNISFTSTGNSLTINGKPYTLVDSIASLAGAIASKPSGLYALVHDYDASVDGTYSSSPIATTLTGTFEGLGNVVSNLNIAAYKPRAPVGFISETGAGAIIRDVYITAVSITVQGGGTAIGALVGGFFHNGAVYNSYASGKIHLANVNGVAGGLVGNSDGSIRNTYANVDISSRITLGYLGGLVGVSYGLVDDSFASGRIGSDDADSGGLMGANGGQVVNCYANGAVNGGGPTGGLIGANGGSVSASYSTGRVKGNDAGGLIGSDGSPAGSLDDTYWDLDTSGVSDPAQGAYDPRNDPGITGLTDAQLKSALPSGFDPKVWAQDTNINNGYPYLIANPPPK